MFGYDDDEETEIYETKDVINAVLFLLALSVICLLAVKIFG